jgi:hypothetical protein
MEGWSTSYNHRKMEARTLLIDLHDMSCSCACITNAERWMEGWSTSIHTQGCIHAVN